MIARDRFIITYAITVFATAFFLSLLSVQGLEIYYSLYLIEFLAILELNGPFKRSVTAKIWPLLFAFLFGFAYVFVQKVLEIVS